jgi:hypothetical protein
MEQKVRIQPLVFSIKFFIFLSVSLASGAAPEVKRGPGAIENIIRSSGKLRGHDEEGYALQAQWRFISLIQ